ncbi:MAG: hypothetical protein SOT68_12320 [Oscillospiraceae bacterium]|nr:hypothetical protein [Oscillospiraceae bacterium]MDD7279834.1 hypothetical protein [Oscillospiraceae bacterium]MDY2864956.1 hypothetical protein [Oscillospiraceae bacterium]
MKHCFLKIFTPIIIAAGITACSVTELSGAPKPQLDGGYTCKCEITAGIIPPGSDSNEECEFAFSGTVKRFGKGFWEMDISSPDTIAGMKLTSCDGDLSSSLGELSMGVSAENVSDKSPVSALFTALDKIALDLENGAELTSGDNGGWVYGCDGINAVFDGDGVITSMAVTSPKMTVNFTEFCVSEEIVTSESTSSAHESTSSSESETTVATVSVSETVTEITTSESICETVGTVSTME